MGKLKMKQSTSKSDIICKINSIDKYKFSIDTSKNNPFYIHLDAIGELKKYMFL